MKFFDIKSTKKRGLYAFLAAVILALLIAYVNLHLLTLSGYRVHNVFEIELKIQPILQEKECTTFLIRTYADHFNLDQPFNIVNTIKSIQAQSNGNWTAYILNTDDKPLPFENHPVRSLMMKDSRVRVLSSGNLRKFDKFKGSYEIIDEALVVLRQFSCPWLVITNGDNYYEKTFLNQVPSAMEASDADMITVDFWSRNYHHPSDLLPVDMSATKCHTVNMSRQADLGGVILSFPRFIREERTFTQYGPISDQDHVLLTDLGHTWKVTTIRQCLFGHGPNPYICSKLQGIWWDSSSSEKELASACWSLTAARLAAQRVFPTPENFKTPAGVAVLRLPDPVHSKNQYKLILDHQRVNDEAMHQQKKVRMQRCQISQRRRDWKLDTREYARLHTDLTLSDVSTPRQLTKHFFDLGCQEMRYLDHPPPKYYQPLVDRSGICEGLKNRTDWTLNYTDYALLNPDLSKHGVVTAPQLVAHFVRGGCNEMRPLSHPPSPDYFTSG